MELKLVQFMRKLGFEDYDAFYAESIGDIRWFWDQVVQDMQIPWLKPYHQVLDSSRGFAWPHWFVNGELNITQAAVYRWLQDEATKNQYAIIAENELQKGRSLTYEQLALEVDRLANSLRQIGIGKGDRAAIYMPMIPETVIAMLALAKLGAIAIPIYSGFAPSTIAKRLHASGAKLLFTADGYYRKGKIIKMKPIADEAANQCSSVEVMVVVRQLGIDIPWDDHRDLAWSTLIQQSSQLVPSQVEPMTSTEPLMLLYTSGTTGEPKGIVHTHCGFPIKAGFDAGYGMDVRQGDRLCWLTDMGWMMGPFMLYGALLNGATMVLYDGSPDYPEPNRLWKLAETHQITHLGVSPTLIRVLMKQGDEWHQQHNLSSLRVIGSSGEPWNDDPWKWLYEQVGQGRIPIVNYSGGTEISGGILSNQLLKDIAPSGFNGPLPGMDADIYDIQGQSISTGIGELVLKQPWVGMAAGFWNDAERYTQTYFSKYPNTWVHGDWVEKDDEGYWYIRGRSDDTLNIAGKRLGPAEMESALVEHAAVLEAATIGIPDDVKGEVAVCLVVISQAYQESKLTIELMNELLHYVEEKLGKGMKPKVIHAAEQLPKTRNGKVVRRAIRAAYLGLDPGDISTLENPEILDTIRLLGSPTV
ncbi:AMP-binding protein [Paenibacillus albiflavus]